MIKKDNYKTEVLFCLGIPWSVKLKPGIYIITCATVDKGRSQLWVLKFAKEEVTWQNNIILIKLHINY